MVLACALLARRGAWLLVRQPVDGLFGGLWLPPSVELEPRATAAEAGRALQVRLGELLRGRPRLGVELARVERRLTHRALTLVARAASAGGPLRAGARSQACWATPAELPGLGVPAAARALLARVGDPAS